MVLDPRRSPAPAVLAFLVGLALHAGEQLLYVRSGPVPILVTAPVVAVLAAVYVRPETSRRRIVGLLAWGGVGSGLAILVYVVAALQYRLPRPLTDPEMVVLDLAMFVWFVGALTVAYAAAANVETNAVDGDRRPLATVVAGPLLQASFVLFVVVLVEAGRYSA